ncbi:MAG: ABC transporter ATP-binding protein [Candidatus Marinimicrobia bacterium]|nr:ABC transporter ATP-binding protein [Candidatus Neomarinimicrobiota bacterium]MCH7954644.1 ABC transporter ATP-binding protein [Candidatus Neomarinimicrobiota bacterium]
MGKIVVEVKGLIKDFPIADRLFRALKGITINIAEGEFMGIVGPSGSGKTTLLNIIGGLDSPTEGTVSVLGLSLIGKSNKELADLRKNGIGFIFQGYNLLPVYTVYENVEFPLLLLNVDSNKRDKMVREAIEWVDLSDKIKSKPAQLSGGESQRVAIARSIVKRPPLVIADELTANLDAKNSHRIMKILLGLNKEIGTTFIFATHDEKVMGYLSRIISIVDGKIESDKFFDRNELREKV